MVLVVVAVVVVVVVVDNVLRVGRSISVKIKPQLVFASLCVPGSVRTQHLCSRYRYNSPAPYSFTVRCYEGKHCYCDGDGWWWWWWWCWWWCHSSCSLPTVVSRLSSLVFDLIRWRKPRAIAADSSTGMALVTKLKDVLQVRTCCCISLLKN